MFCIANKQCETSPTYVSVPPKANRIPRIATMEKKNILKLVEVLVEVLVQFSENRIQALVASRSVKTR